MATPRSSVVDTSRSLHARLRPVPIGSVHLEDAFWAPRLRQMREVTLPTQHEILEETGRLFNFRRAAGKETGDFRGIYFNDSDVYKWIEGCAYALADEHDGTVERLADDVIDQIAAAQHPDGYLNTYYMFDREKDRWSNLKDMHELYCAGHLFHGAVAYHRATGKRKLLDVAVRFADHIDATFGPGKRPGTPGHPQIEMGLVELYRETGEQRYLKLAQFMLDERGKGVIGGSNYHQDHAPFRDLPDVTGHAVRAMYLNCGAADLYMESGERALMTALERMWRNMTERRMYITGGVGARHEGEAFGGDYELPNERAYSETCGAIANAIWNWRMLLATGEERFADVFELATYNGSLAGIALDGRHYFYVNPLASRGGHHRQRWFGCACCPTNIIRLVGEIPGSLYTTSDEGIWAHLYAQSTARIAFGGQTVTLVQRTDYPWDGVVRFDVTPESPGEFSIFLRIPGWSEGAHVSVNGERAGVRVSPGGYFELRRRWESGDSIKLDIPMPVRAFVSHPRVEATAGRFAIKRGPIVYCVESTDNADADVWASAMQLGSPVRTQWESDLLGGIVTLSCEGVLDDAQAWERRLFLSVEQTLGGTSRTLTAAPYYAWDNRQAGPMTVWVRGRGV
ncbi:glycoside hydrolase family 127 protein [Candidatus Poribacteria bacterium]|nr:glycoside hydrolase family 127 protein [Candidatus Poribacteria bacterium]